VIKVGKDEIIEKLADTLARVYMKTPWRQIGVKNSHDYFTDRLRAASRANTLPSFLNELTRLLSVQYAKLDPENVDQLREHENDVLRMLREETIYVAMKTIERVEELRESTELEEVEM